MTDTRQLVVFSLGAEEYAVPIDRVQEIIGAVAPRAVASHSPWVRGVISLRGKILVVWDLATRLGVPRDASAPGTLVVVETGAGLAAVAVDAVREILAVDPAAVDRDPVTGAEAIEGIVTLEDRLLVLLDLDLVFAAPAVPEPLAA